MDDGKNEVYLRPKQLKRNSMLIPPLLDLGCLKETLIVSKPQEETYCIQNLYFIKLLESKKILIPKNTYIVESLVPHRKMIWNIKWSIYKSTQLEKLLETLEAELIIKRADSKSYLEKYSKEKSQRLASVTKIGFSDLGMNYLKKSAKHLELKSWYSTHMATQKMGANVNLQMTSLPSAMSLLQRKMEKEHQEIEEKDKIVIMAKKYKVLKTNHYTRKVLNRMFWLYRKVYNQCVNIAKDSGKIPSRKTLGELIAFKNPDAWIHTMGFKRGEISKDILDEAIKEFLKSASTCFKNLKSGNIKKFRMKYKSYKDSQSMIIRKRLFKKLNTSEYCFKSRRNCIKKACGECKYCRGFRLCFGQSINLEDTPNSLDFCNSITLHKNRNKKYYEFIVSHKKKLEAPKTCRNVSILDPGEIIFQTAYSPRENGEADITFYGVNCRETIKKHNSIIDKCTSVLKLLEKSKGKKYRKKRYNLRKCIAKNRVKLGNKVDTMHHTIAKDLLTKNDLVIVGDLKTKDCVSNIKHLVKSVKRSLLGLKHFQFKMRIFHKAQKMNKAVVFINENYTSQKCFRCGKNTKVTSRLYCCKSCGYKDHRDVNPSKNMLKDFITNMNSLVF